MGLFSPKLSTKHMALLCRTMAATTQGMMSVERALRLISGERAMRPIRRLLLPVLAAIQSGATLTEAFRTQRRKLPDEFIELITAGERGGKVEPAIAYLADDYDRRLAFQQLMWKQMTYPLAVWIAGAYVIPYFQGLFLTRDSVELYSARFLLRVFWEWVPTLTVLIILGQLGLLEKIVYGIVSRIWVIGGILHNFAVVRFLRCFAMLLDAGLSVPVSIERAAAATANPRLRKALMRAVPAVQRGEDVATSLENVGILPPLAAEMIHTGEHTGKLETLLTKSAQYIEESTLFRRHILQVVIFALLIPALLLPLAARQFVLMFLGIFRRWYGPLLG